MFRMLAMTCCLMSFGTFSFAEVRDNSTGTEFPSEVSFESGGKTYKLEATGVATRKKFFVKVYSVAHYLQEGAAKGSASKLQEILSDDNAKQLTLKWQRNVDTAKIQEGYLESFKKTLSSSDYGQLQSEINQFVGYFNREVQKGEEEVLRWIPGGTVEVIIKGAKVGTINNAAFAKGLWSIWFGDHSVVDRDKLVSLMK